MRPDGPRDPIAGPDSGPEPPFPIRLSGPVIKGFGRGSKELGIPTANIPPDGLSEYPDIKSGVYFGVASLDLSWSDKDPEKEEPSSSSAKKSINPCVLSIGFNPFYKNTVRSVEIHILSPLTTTASANSTEPDSTTNATQTHTNFHRLPDFYGAPLDLLILGYIRPEYDYVSLEALIDDIRVDCDVARRSLEREAYKVYLEEGKFA